MGRRRGHRAITLSIVIPCYNEENTLKRCVEKVLELADENLILEIIIVDDHSTDNSLAIAKELEKEHVELSVFCHANNRGKGAALRTGFKEATGDFAAVQDADLEYDPRDLVRLLAPLIKNEADVVLGSRFLSSGAHRVLYFWHYLGNRFLTFLSNMFTDLNLTDMETCYKVFRLDVIQGIKIQENRFGFEPEIVAKISQMRLRIFEMGISYYGRTYEEGKKIGARDGVRAVYCIFRYNAHRAPLPVQFLLYLFIGGFAAASNLLIFLVLFSAGVSIGVSVGVAFVIAAAVNYLLCIYILFRHNAKWNSILEILVYVVLVILVGFIDFLLTSFLYGSGFSPVIAKLGATLLVLVLNFAGRRFWVFPESPLGAWKPQEDRTKVSKN